MPRRRLASLALVVLGALISIQLTGCTAIGFGIGALTDRANGKGTANRLVTVHTGTSVTMWLRDGRRLDGRFLGSRDSLSETPLTQQPIGDAGSAPPLRAVLLVGTNRGIQQILTQDVSRVSVPVMHGKVIGLISGLALDALFVYAIYQAAEGIAGN